MNRDIEFRGRTVILEWQYGFYTMIGNKHYICTPKGKNGVVRYCIDDANTIGQYTGLKDKNGKKIFEGDIVKNEDYTLAVVYNPKVQGFVLTDKNNWLNEPTDRIYDCDDTEEKFINNFFEYNCVSYEVIGNIYENKELLEG